MANSRIGANSRVGTWWRRSVLVVGVVVLVAAVDVAVGTAWHHLGADQAAPVRQVEDRLNFSGSTETFEDPRAELPAMAGAPWAAEYYRELQLTQSSYWPFTESRPLTYEGRYITIEGWSRRSYDAASVPADAPVVWLFGGSAAWGEGQRDDYTIASHLARIAEREGSPIVVVNYGQRGWTHYQEMILFEQLLAERPPPGVALFYDGTNELNAQSLSAKGVPTHTLVDQYAALLSGGSVTVDDEPIAEPPLWRLVWEAYRDRSAIVGAVGAIEERVVPRAGATVGATVGDAAMPPRPGVQIYPRTIDDARRAVEVYERGRSLTQELARRHGVEPIFFWQPLQEDDAEEWAADHVSAPTINLRAALEDRSDVFIDGAHTNEEGARIVAEQIWLDLADRVSSPRRPGGRDPSPEGSTDTGSSTPSTDPPSDAANLALAAAALDRAGDDVCAVERWKVWLGSLTAASTDDRAALIELTSRFLEQLLATRPDSIAVDDRRIKDFVAALPSIVVEADPDPAEPLLPQVAATEAAAGFIEDFGELSARIAERCAAEPGG